LDNLYKSEILSFLLQSKDQIRNQSPQVVFLYGHIVINLNRSENYIEEIRSFSSLLEQQHLPLLVVHQFQISEADCPFHLPRGDVQLRDARLQNYQEFLAVYCLEGIDEDGVLEFLFILHLLEDREELAISLGILLQDEAFRVEYSRESHTFLIGFILEHECVVLDSFGCLRGEVDYACNWLDY
jgi:hypothetical protein